MRHKILLVCLVAGAGSCGRLPGAASSDTTFVELRRYEDRGSKLANGACRWSTTTMPSGPDTLLKRVFFEERSIPTDREKCLRLVVQGYRKARPVIDATNGDSASSTVLLDSAALRSAQRGR